MTIKGTYKVNLNPNAKAEAMKSVQETVKNIDQLTREFQNAVVQARAGQGSNYFGRPLKDVFRERGLTDEIMDRVIQAV